MNRRFGTGFDYTRRSRDQVELFLDEKMLAQPLRWKKPRRVFVASMTDLFADFVPDEWIDRVFAMMAVAQKHQFQVLTKRARRMREYLTGHAAGGRHIWKAGQAIEMPPGQHKPETVWPLSNVWLVVSAENQKCLDERVPDLLATPAAVRGVSAEPLLGPLEFRQTWRDYLEGWDTEPTHVCHGDERVCRAKCPEPEQVQTHRIDWVIVGGESGAGARPMDVAWARDIVRQCSEAGIPCFVKQMGRRVLGTGEGFRVDRWLLANDRVFVPPIIGANARVRPDNAIGFQLFDSKGGDPSEWPEDLRIREMPEAQPEC